MRQTHQHQTFVCQINESLKVLRLRRDKDGAQYVEDFFAEPIPLGLDDEKKAELVRSAFKKLGFDRNPLIVALSRGNATCRYLKVPTQSPDEIEKIISLQAPKYLPYQPHELVTGYQHIENDKEGYAQIEAIIAHKEAIQRSLNFVKGLKTPSCSIVLTSYGLAKLFSTIYPGESAPLMIVDIDHQQAEIVITAKGKVLFSRAFTVLFTQPHWENHFLAEIEKSIDAYRKVVNKDAPVKIVVTGYQKSFAKVSEALARHTSLPVETISYLDHIKTAQPVQEAFRDTEYSFASLLGLAVGPLENSLNLLPSGEKLEARRTSLRKELLKNGAFTAGIALILFLAGAKNLDNKKTYLLRLNAEVENLTRSAAPLEALDKRLKLLNARAHQRLSSLAIIEGISTALPAQISLSTVAYENEKQITLHGQTPELKNVLDFVSALEKTPVFTSLAIKIKYATQKSGKAGDFIDFEITCLKEK